jgi:hypothetical protein
MSRMAAVALGSWALKRPKQAMVGVLGLVWIIVLFIWHPGPQPRSRLGHRSSLSWSEEQPPPSAPLGPAQLPESAA